MSVKYGPMFGWFWQQVLVEAVFLPTDAVVGLGQGRFPVLGIGTGENKWKEAENLEERISQWHMSTLW